MLYPPNRLQTFLAPADFKNSNVFGTKERKFGWGQKICWPYPIVDSKKIGDLNPYSERTLGPENLIPHGYRYWILLVCCRFKLPYPYLTRRNRRGFLGTDMKWPYTIDNRKIIFCLNSCLSEFHIICYSNRISYSCFIFRISYYCQTAVLN